VDELSRYNGTDEGLPILLGILGYTFPSHRISLACVSVQGFPPCFVNTRRKNFMVLSVSLASAILTIHWSVFDNDQSSHLALQISV
jgi:hypothetical protein